MEEKIKQIQTYLSAKANPVVQPMLELMAKERPENVLPWMQAYVNRKMRNFLYYFRVTAGEAWSGNFWWWGGRGVVQEEVVAGEEERG